MCSDGADSHARAKGSSFPARLSQPSGPPTRLRWVLHVRCRPSDVWLLLLVGWRSTMTMTPRRETLIILHTLLGSWHRYPFDVHYCNMCDDLYDWWLGCEGCG